MPIRHGIRNLASRLKGRIEDVADAIEGAMDVDGDGDADPRELLTFDFDEIRAAGRDCHASAREASALCVETVTKAAELVEFGNDVRVTLTGFADGEPDASVLADIRDLMDGDKVRAAMALAGEMDDLALSCVERSVGMIEAMERGVEALPDVFEGQVREKLSEGGAPADIDVEELDVEDDVGELSACMDAVREVNLFTAMDAGVGAFRSLTAKGDVCKVMFETVREFAEDVVSVSDAVRSFEVTQVGKMVRVVKDLIKDMWRCLRLSGLIKRFAEQVGRLIRWIIDLFKEASSKLGAIWGALAYAKECMADCIQHVMEALGLCDEARDKSAALVNVSGEIGDHLENVLGMNKSSIASIRDLMDGSEIQLAIELATTMDDTIMAAVDKVVAMVQRVTEGFENLPDVLREGIPDPAEAGAKDDDPDPADVEGDIAEMDRCRGEIEGADAFHTIRASADGFMAVRDKAGSCGDMISSSRDFAEDCRGTIESFLGVWDLRSAQDKILEMCRLVRLGDMVRQFAEEIDRLIMAVVAVMRAVKERIKEFDLSDPGELIDDIKGLGKKLAFWKKR